MGASALFLSVWVTYQRPVHALRETFGFRKAYAEEANALAETALVGGAGAADCVGRRRTRRLGEAGGLIGGWWPSPQPEQSARPKLERGGC